MSTERTDVALRSPVTPMEPVPELPAERDPYEGVATLELTPEQEKVLATPLPLEDLDIKPTGEVYASQVHYRRVLNKVFGAGRWALVPRGEWRKQDQTLCREYALIIHGRFVAEAIGEQDYIEKNPNMTWATAAEGAKSNALMRCCKDLGIASECWDRRFTEQFKREHCAHVWVRPPHSGEVKARWRRKDADPLVGERGFVKDKSGPEPEPEPPPDTPPPNGAPVITEHQVADIDTLLRDVGRSEKQLMKFLGYGTRLEHIHATDYQRVIEEISARKER